jgi:hypothetical protein
MSRPMATCIGEGVVMLCPLHQGNARRRGGGNIVSCARRGRGWGSSNIMLCLGSIPRQGVSSVLSESESPSL